MRNFVLHAIIITVLTIFASCTGRPSPVDSADDELTEQTDDTDTPELTDAADSLGYFLALSVTERVRDELDSLPMPEDGNLAIDLFNSGLRSILSLDSSHVGFEYGALQGSSISHQIADIRASGIHVDGGLICAGFSKAVADNSAVDSVAAQSCLDRMMKPVNKRLIIKMRQNSKRNNFRRPDGTVMKFD